MLDFLFLFTISEANLLPQPNVGSVEMEDGFPISTEWTIELSSRKKVIDPTSDELITTLFDGGENVYVKVSLYHMPTRTVVLIICC